MVSSSINIHTVTRPRNPACAVYLWKGGIASGIGSQVQTLSDNRWVAPNPLRSFNLLNWWVQHTSPQLGFTCKGVAKSSPQSGRSVSVVKKVLRRAFTSHPPVKQILWKGGFAVDGGSSDARARTLSRGRWLKPSPRIARVASGPFRPISDKQKPPGAFDNAPGGSRNWSGSIFYLSEPHCARVLMDCQYMLTSSR